MSLYQKFVSKVHCKKGVLSISHQNILTTLGGTEKLILLEQRAFESKDRFYIHIAPAGLIWGEAFYGVMINQFFVGYHAESVLLWTLGRLHKKGFEIEATHIHHTINIQLDSIIKIISIFPSQVRFFVHDFYSACPQINFMKNGVEFCGGPEINAAICDGCQFGSVRKRKHPEFENLLDNYVDLVIAPSEFASKTWLKSFPRCHSKTIVVPHLVLKASLPGELMRENSKLRIAYVGYKSHYKGFETWLRFVKHFQNHPKFEFFHFGDDQIDYSGATHVKVNMLGGQAMANRLREFNIDVSFLWSICPETFSFTLYESWSASSFIVTNPNSGNIAFIVRANELGEVFQSELQLFSFFDDPKNIERLIGRNKTFNRFEFNDSVLNLPVSVCKREISALVPQLKILSFAAFTVAGVGANVYRKIESKMRNWKPMLKRIRRVIAVVSKET
jgi:hypothetical protein